MGYRIQLLLAQFLAKCSHKIEANGEDADHLDEGELGREEDIVGEGGQILGASCRHELRCHHPLGQLPGDEALHSRRTLLEHLNLGAEPSPEIFDQCKVVEFSIQCNRSQGCQAIPATPTIPSSEISGGGGRPVMAHPLHSANGSSTAFSRASVRLD